MKVLFLSSGNNRYGVNPIIKAQGESLKKSGINITYFTIKGKGIIGYIRNIKRLRNHLRIHNYDIVHSHYLHSSIVASLSKPRNIIISLMGSDVYSSSLWRFVVRALYRKWDGVIVKSDNMKKMLNIENIKVIPNGVDLDRFYVMNKNNARKHLGWGDKKYILFSSIPEKTEKKYELAKKAVNLLSDKEIELVVMRDIPHKSVVYYLNAADLLLMTSKYEGSPNIIKEAMVCNCPIVSTDVGDLRWLFGELSGYYIASFAPEDVANKIKLALEFSECYGRTAGRKRIKELGLDSKTIALKIINVYKSVLQEI